MVVSISFSTQQLWEGDHKGLEAMPRNPSFFHSVNELSQSFSLALSQLWWSILARILVRQPKEVRSAGEMAELWEELSLDVVPRMYLRHDRVWKHMGLVLCFSSSCPMLRGVPCVSGRRAAEPQAEPRCSHRFTPGSSSCATKQKNPSCLFWFDLFHRFQRCRQPQSCPQKGFLLGLDHERVVKENYAVILGDPIKLSHRLEPCQLEAVLNADFTLRVSHLLIFHEWFLIFNRPWSLGS